MKLSTNTNEPITLLSVGKMGRGDLFQRCWKHPIYRDFYFLKWPAPFISSSKNISTLKLWIIFLFFVIFWVFFFSWFSTMERIKSWHKNLRILGYLSILEDLSLPLYHHHQNYSGVLCCAQGFAGINQHNLHNNPEGWALSGSPLCRW